MCIPARARERERGRELAIVCASLQERERESESPPAPDQVLLCTGSFAKHPPGIPFDSRIVHDSDSVNGLNYLPKSVVVAGSAPLTLS